VRAPLRNIVSLAIASYISHICVVSLKPQATPSVVGILGPSEWPRVSRSERQAHVGVEHHLALQGPVCSLPLELPARLDFLSGPANCDDASEILTAESASMNSADPEAVETRVLWKSTAQSVNTHQCRGLSPS